MSVAYSEIARVLDGARRRQGWIVFATALALGTAAALLFLLGGAYLLGRDLWSPSAVRLSALALSALSAAVALAYLGAALMRRASSALSVARTVGEAAPEVESDLLSSVELEEAYEEIAASRRYSLALVEAHASSTAERVRGLDLERVVPARPARRALAVLLAVLAANFFALVASPHALVKGYERLAGAALPESVRRTEPITGDIELTYAYPAYMRREPKTLSGTGGEVSAPKGTEVTLRTRADREVESAEIEVARAVQEEAPAAKAAPAGPSAAPPARKAYRLEVKGGRELGGRFVVEEPGSYRFRFSKGRRLLAEGPPLPIAVEADAFPEIRISAPAEEVELDARAVVHVEWSASDDVGLSELALVVKPPEGDEQRTVLRTFDGVRQESGVEDLPLAPYRLAEGEKLLYWLEVKDNDTVSGPKRSASSTHAVKVYSEAEHERAALARAQALWEELVRLLGDRLELFERDPGRNAAAESLDGERLAAAQATDGRTRELEASLRAAAAELRRDRAAPRELARALASVAANLRPLGEELAALRSAAARALRGRRAVSGAVLAHLLEEDLRLDRELERDTLYLEQLFDRERAEDLVRVAKDLASRRRELAELLERYRQAPTEEGRKELLAEVARLKARMSEMLRRMGELAKGLGDEHLNREALAELAKSQDALAGLAEVEKKLAAGDVEGALKALDQLGNAMQEMLSALEHTAGEQSPESAELLRQMLAFKRQLEGVQAEQGALAGETGALKAEYQRRIEGRLKELEALLARLSGLTAEARREIALAEKGVGLRSEEDFAQGRDRLSDLERALAAKDLDAALQSAKRALPPLQRLATGLEDDAAIAERYRALQSKDPRELREAQKHAVAALSPARRVKDELEQLFPDPKSVLGPREQQKLSELSRRQGELERRMGELAERLRQLAERAPIFPPQAEGTLQSSQGHMQRAEGELAQKNPQAGHGEQELALQDLSRFRRGLEEMSKNGQRGGGAFPLPFGEGEAEGEGEGEQPSAEKVEIPGADAYKVPDAFRKDLLDAMKQGAPEAYKGEVARYYEELVK